MSEKKRIVWIDQLRAFAFYFVYLGHIAPEGPLNDWIYSFHMPMFFLISGCNLNLTKIYNTKFKDYIARLAERMIVPYLWLQLLSLGVKYLLLDEAEVVPDYLLGILTANSHIVNAPSNPMYFVLLLFLAQLGMWLIIKLTHKNRLLIAIIVSALSVISAVTSLTPMPWHINVVPTAMLMIFLGRLLMDAHLFISEKLKGKALIPLRAVFGVILVAAGVCLSQQNGRVSIHGNAHGESYIMFVVTALVTCVGFALLFMLIPELKLLIFMGMNTFFFLGIHDPFIYTVRFLFKEQWDKWWFIAIASVVCYFLPVPIAWLFNKFAPYTCGMPLRKNDLAVNIIKVGVIAAALATPFVCLRGVIFSFPEKYSVTVHIVSLVLLALISFGLERLFSLKAPVVFLQNKKKPTARALHKPQGKKEAERRFFDEDGIEVIIPREEEVKV